MFKSLSASNNATSSSTTTTTTNTTTTPATSSGSQSTGNDVTSNDNNNNNTTTTEPCHTKAEEEKAEPQLAGADDFLPLFIWVVLRSNIPKLSSNCAFIESFLNPARMISKSGYCLINLRSAINFVNYVDPSTIKIDPDYFHEQVAIREKKYEISISH